MPRLTSSLPKYRKHRASGQAVVTINGRDHYLGPHTTRASHREYDRVIAEYLSSGRSSTFGSTGRALTVVELANEYLKHAKVGAYCWGLVDGKSQTKYPWKTWQLPATSEPTPWHHDIFHTDGQPYRDEETDLVKSLTK